MHAALLAVSASLVALGILHYFPSMVVGVYIALAGTGLVPKISPVSPPAQG